MQTHSAHARILILAGLCLAATGCGQARALQAQRSFQEANALYSREDYRAAAAKYEEAIARNPELTAAYFYLANSLENLYDPARRGEPANDQLLLSAVEHYQKSVSAEQDPVLRQRSLEFLVGAFGPEKLNEPSRQKPLLEEMIRINPADPSAYFALASVQEASGDHASAEQTLLRAREARPKDPAVHTQLAAFHNRRGNFDQTISALQERARAEPSNPEAHHLIATYHWEKVHRDYRLSEAEKRRYVEAGIEAADRAIRLNGEYVDAITYKNLLLRLRANLENDRTRQRALLQEADRLRDQAQKLRSRQSGGSRN